MEQIHLNLSSMRSLFIEMYFQDTKLSSGTAFVVTLGNLRGIVTNRHNVTGRNQATGAPLSSHGGVPDRIVVWHNTGTQFPTWSPFSIPLYDGEEKRWLEHPSLGERAGIAFLPIEETLRVKLYPYDLALAPEILQRPVWTCNGFAPVT